MNKVFQIRKLLYVAIALMAFTAVHAGGYVGAAAGQGSTKVSDISGATFDGSDTAYKVFGGYRFLKFFGVEADYRNFGQPEENVSGADVQLDSTAFDVWAVGVLPIGPFEIFGKAGYSAWDAEFSSSLGGSESDSGSDLAYGLGAAYNFSKVEVRLEYEQFELADVDNVNMFTVGAAWRF